jgi:hypothetical protein
MIGLEGGERSGFAWPRKCGDINSVVFQGGSTCILGKNGDINASMDQRFGKISNKAPGK